MGTEKNQSPQPLITCPGCSTKLSVELTRLLLEGRTVYCEMCGFPYVGIQAGEVKPLEKSGVRIKNASDRQQREDQWDEWRKEWQNIKKKIKETFSSPSNSAINYNSQNTYQQSTQNNGQFSTNGSSPKSVENSQSYRTSENSPYGGSYNQNYNHNTSTAIPPSYTPPHNGRTDGSPYSTNEISPSNIQDLNKAIRVLNKISPIFEIIMLIVSITSMFANTMDTQRMFGYAFMIPLAIFILNVDTKIFIPRTERMDYQHGGLDMIIIGAFGLNAYGSGVFVMVKGILTLVIEYSLLKQNAKYTSFIRQNPRNESIIWSQQVIYAIIPFLSGLSICVFFTGVNNLLFEETEVFTIIPVIIIGFICTMIFIGKIIPELQRKDIENISQNVGIKSIILGVLSIATSVGVIYITIGIMIIHINKTVQSDRTISTYQGDIALFGKEPINEIHPLQNIGGSHNIIEPHNILEPLNALDSTKSPNPVSNVQKDTNNRPIRRYDPATGKLLVPDPIPQSYFPPKETPPQQPIDQPEELSKERVFSVLDAEVREKLINLDISEKEREDVAQNLVMLAKETQLKYLQEYNDANISIEEESAQYISRINKLELPEDQKNFLIQQLEFMPLTQQSEFVAYLEQTAAKTASK